MIDSGTNISIVKESTVVSNFEKEYSILIKDFCSRPVWEDTTLVHLKVGHFNGSVEVGAVRLDDTLQQQLLGIDIGVRNLQRLINDSTLVSHSAGTVTTHAQTKAREDSDPEEAQSYAHEQPHPVNSNEVEEDEAQVERDMTEEGMVEELEVVLLS